MSLALGLGLILVMYACSDDNPSPFAVDVVNVNDARALTLFTSCASNVHAKVSESAEQVLITDVSGNARRGEDCAASVVLRLDTPLANRRVVVNGTEWGRVRGGSCAGEYMPTQDLPPGCRLFT